MCVRVCVCARVARCLSIALSCFSLSLSCSCACSLFCSRALAHALFLRLTVQSRLLPLFPHCCWAEHWKNSKTAKADAVQWVNQRNVRIVLEHVTAELLQSQPDDPLEFMIDTLKRGQQDTQQAALERPPTAARYTCVCGCVGDFVCDCVYIFFFVCVCVSRDKTSQISQLARGGTKRRTRPEGASAPLRQPAPAAQPGRVGESP